MARVTRVGKGGAGFPEPLTPISGELKRNRESTMSAAGGVRMIRNSSEFSASKSPVGDTEKESSAARRSMLHWKGY